MQLCSYLQFTVVEACSICLGMSGEDSWRGCRTMPCGGQADFEPADVDGRPVDVAFFDAGHLIERLCCREMQMEKKRRRNWKLQVQPQSFRAVATVTGCECDCRGPRHGPTCLALFPGEPQKLNIPFRGLSARSATSALVHRQRRAMG